MKFITAILSAFFCLSIQAQLVTYPGTLSPGCRTMMTIPYAYASPAANGKICSNTTYR